MQAMLLHQVYLLIMIMLKAMQIPRDKQTHPIILKKECKRKIITHLYLSCFIKSILYFFFTPLLSDCFHQELFSLDPLRLLKQSITFILLQK